MAKTNEITLNEQDLQTYAETYLRTYQMNRQSAMDYITNLRRLISKDVALQVVQRAQEMAIKAYRTATFNN